MSKKEYNMMKSIFGERFMRTLFNDLTKTNG